MVDDDLWVGRARHTWDTLESVHGNRHAKRQCPATLINEFAGQALCRQRSHGLTHHHAWSQPLKAAKIQKLRLKYQPGAPKGRRSAAKKIKKNPGLTGSAPLGMTVWFNLLLEVGLVGQQGGVAAGDRSVSAVSLPQWVRCSVRGWNQFKVFSVLFRSLVVSVGELACTLSRSIIIR